MPILTEIASPLLRRPLLCLTLGWIAGIVLAVFWRLPWATWALLAAVCCLVGLVCPPARPVERMVGLFAACMLAAATLTAWQTAPIAPDDPRYLPPGWAILRGYPAAEPQPTGSGWRVPFRVQARQADGDWRPAAGLVYLTGHAAAPAIGHPWQVLGQTLTAPTAANPYGFSWWNYLGERGYSYRVRAASALALPGDAPLPRLQLARGYLCDRLARTMPARFGPLYAQVLDGLVMGIHGDPLPDDLTALFRQAGIIHLMVVSGSQVSLFAYLLLLPLAYFPGNRHGTGYPRLRLILLLASLPLLAAYIALADRGPSVDRALIMFLHGSLAVFLAFSPLARRRFFVPDGLTLLAASAWIILIVRPLLLFSPSMQLSYAAVFGLQTVTPVLMRLVPRWPRWLALLCMATLGAEAMTFPVLAWHFGNLPVFGPLTNLVAVPLVALVLPLGLLAMLLAPVLPPLAYALNMLNGWCIQGLIASADLTAHLPWAQVPWYVRSPWPLILYLLLLTVALALLSRWANRRQQDWPVPAGSTPLMW